MWANFINPPHIRSRMRVICGSHEPSFPSEDSNMEAAAHLEAINDEQKATSPMGASRIERLGVQDLFICGGNKLKSHWPKSSHFGGF